MSRNTGGASWPFLVLKDKAHRWERVCRVFIVNVWIEVPARYWLLLVLAFVNLPGKGGPNLFFSFLKLRVKSADAVVPTSFGRRWLIYIFFSLARIILSQSKVVVPLFLQFHRGLSRHLVFNFWDFSRVDWANTFLALGFGERLHGCTLCLCLLSDCPILDHPVDVRI